MPRLLRWLCCVSILLIAGCDRDGGEQAVTQSVDSFTLIPAEDSAALDTAWAQVEAALGTEMHLRSPLLHDEQMVPSGNVYKPGLIRASISHALDVDTLTLSTYRDQQPRLIATVDVSATGHENEGFRKGRTCIFVTSTSPNPNINTLRYATALVHEGKGCPDRPAQGSQRPMYVSEYAQDSVPPVARIDFDSISGRLVVAAKCMKNHWCQFSAHQGKGKGNRHKGASRTIPGWYDEQRLSVPGDGGGLVPSPLRAYVFPVDTLAIFKTEENFDEWIHVATIAFDEDASGPATDAALERYRTKWKLRTRPTTADSVRLELKRQPDSTWIARYSMRGVYGDTVRKVTYLKHAPATMKLRETLDQLQITNEYARRSVMAAIGPIDVPGTARWGWDPTDETVWVRCAVGCCEVGEDN